MTGRFTRRSLLVGSLGCLGSLGAASLAVTGCTTVARDGAPGAAGAAPSGTVAPDSALAALEARFGGRLGVFALDTGNGASVGHRADERFPMCSTFKVLAASAILRLRHTQPGLLDRLVRYSNAQLVSGAPVTSQHIADGMTVAALCQAAIAHSDNTAANLLLTILGGPPAVTAFARTLGDQVSRLDRIEPALNDVPPGELRDTSTPAQMAADLHRLALGDALDPVGRDLLTDWLLGNTTGAERIRAGLPARWRVGDKTGTGSRGEMNDLAVVWLPRRAPLIISVYAVPGDPAAKPDNQVVADAASIVAKALVPTT
ncbi:MAG: beta-lactamase class [Pseudonocardiales bacterium]|nr:beta-lactamase class [Pseudonocardiales bacterium]